MILLLCPSFHAFPTDLTTTVFLITQFFMLAPQLLIDSYFVFSKYRDGSDKSSASTNTTGSNAVVLGSFGVDNNQLESYNNEYFAIDSRPYHSVDIIHNDTLFWNIHFAYLLLLSFALAILPVLSLMAYIREKMFLRWTTHFNNSDKWNIVKILFINFVPLMLLEFFPLCLLFSECFKRYL